jgi:HK97 family phage major capsid protein
MAETKKEAARRLIERAREIARSDEYVADDAVAVQNYVQAVEDARTMSKAADAEHEAAQMEARAQSEAEANERAKSLLAGQARTERPQTLRDLYQAWEDGGRNGKFSFVQYPDYGALMPQCRYEHWSNRPAVVEGRNWKPTFAEQRTDVLYDTSGYGAAYLWPTKTWPDLVWHEMAVSGVLQSGPTIIQTPDMAPIVIPTFATDAASDITVEGTESTETGPTFAHEDLGAYRIDGHFHVGNETLASSAVPLESILNQAAMRAMSEIQATLLANGSGSSHPQGLSGHATCRLTTGQTTGSASAISMDELIGLKLSVLPGARARGKFLFASTAYVLLAKLKSGEGNYLWEPSAQANTPDRLLGCAAFEEAGYDATGTTAHVIGTFGDMSQFWVRFAGPVVIEASEQPTFTSFETTWRFAKWIDSEVMDVNAIKALVCV